MKEISPHRERLLHELEKKLGTSFLSLHLLDQALTHSSYGHDHKIPDNERLEFLGDAVLKLVISEHLFHKFPEKEEGDMTKIRANVISDDTLGKISKKVSLGQYLQLSQNERKSGGGERKSNLANAFEALLGAIFIDAGIGKSRELILEWLGSEIEKVSKAGYISDYKSALQEYTQKHKIELPRYKIIKESGLKHRRVFWIEVKIRGKKYGMGRGRNKKEAEQRAAMHALMRIRHEGGKAEKHKLSEIILSVRKRIKI